MTPQQIDTFVAAVSCIMGVLVIFAIAAIGMYFYAFVASICDNLDKKTSANKDISMEANPNTNSVEVHR